jgi:hypothetical protein
MRSKTLALVLFFMNIAFLSNAQKTQTYSGRFEDDSQIPGMVTYSYYEKDNEEIKHGPFSFSFSSNGVKKDLKGSFVNGMRNGPWKSTLAGRGISVSIDGVFKNGLPSGKFTYTAKNNGTVYQSMSVEFKDGVAVGNFRYNNDATKEKVTGQLLPNGYMNGDWKILEDGTEYLIRYKQGVLVLYVEKDATTGQVNRENDYANDILGLKKEDIVEEDTKWDLYDESDTYGVYFQKYLWKALDPNTVGGIAENALSGFFYKTREPKQ